MSVSNTKKTNYFFSAFSSPSTFLKIKNLAWLLSERSKVARQKDRKQVSSHHRRLHEVEGWASLKCLNDYLRLIRHSRDRRTFTCNPTLVQCFYIFGKKVVIPQLNFFRQLWDRMMKQRCAGSDFKFYNFITRPSSSSLAILTWLWLDLTHAFTTFTDKVFAQSYHHPSHYTSYYQRESKLFELYNRVVNFRFFSQINKLGRKICIFA